MVFPKSPRYSEPRTTVGPAQHRQDPKPEAGERTIAQALRGGALSTVELSKFPLDLLNSDELKISVDPSLALF